MERPRGMKRFSKYPDDKDEKKQKLGHLPEEMMAYYRHVSATLDAGFDDDDPSAKRDFLDNVFNALKDEGVQASQNQTVSRILEALFTYSEAAHLRIIFCEFCKHLTTVSFDRFASHVLQSLIHYLPVMYDDADAEEDDRRSLKAALDQLCQYSLSQIHQFMTDTYGSHVLRSLLETLGGVQVKEEVIRSHVSRNQRKDTDSLSKSPVSRHLTSDFKTRFDAIRNKVVTLCNYADHLTDPNYCPVLQTLLLILHKSSTDEYNQLAESIMEKACPPTEDVDEKDVAKNLPAVLQNSVGSYLIELLVSLTSEVEIPNLYKKLFKGKLIYFAVHPVANYVLQKLCSCVTNTKILKEIVTEISPFMEDILAVSHMGIITRLAEACKRNQTQQEAFIQAVMKAFHCDDPEERRPKIAPLIASMQTYDMFFSPPKLKVNEEEQSEKPPPNLVKSVNIHGSLLLQQVLQFDRPKHIVTSLLSLSPAELSNLASNMCGSHVVEAFFNSSTVWDRNKEEFLKKLKGFYVPIACSKNGSRCLEGIWKSCALKMKILIAEELTKSRERIESDKFGHFLYHNFALLKFSTRKKEWMDIQAGVKKKQEMLQAILEGDSSKKKKNRKRKGQDANIDESEKSSPQEKMSRIDNPCDDRISGDDNDCKDDDDSNRDQSQTDAVRKNKDKKNKNKKKKKKGGERENENNKGKTMIPTVDEVDKDEAGFKHKNNRKKKNKQKKNMKE